VYDNMSQHKERPWNGYGVASLGLAVAAFVSAPFLLLFSVVGFVPAVAFVPAVLAAGGVVFAWIGLSRKDRRPGLAVAGLIVSAVLFGLSLGIATLWTQLITDPAFRDWPELRELIDHIRRLLFGS
jgi:hypothetical protein